MAFNARRHMSTDAPCIVGSSCTFLFISNLSVTGSANQEDSPGGFGYATMCTHCSYHTPFLKQDLVMLTHVINNTHKLNIFYYDY